MGVGVSGDDKETVDRAITDRASRPLDRRDHLAFRLLFIEQCSTSTMLIITNKDTQRYKYKENANTNTKASSRTIK